MSNGSRNKNLLVIIVVLLLTNIALLGYFLWFKNSGKEQHSNNRERTGIADMLRKEVGFDTVQMTSYREMRETQKQVLRPMFDAMRTAKDSLFSQIGKSGPEDTLVLKMAAVIGQRQQDLDMQTFRYFSKVRELCKPDQVRAYDSLITQMFRRMGRPKSDAEKKNGK
jgi:hypothetical protein